MYVALNEPPPAATDCVVGETVPAVKQMACVVPGPVTFTVKSPASVPLALDQAVRDGRIKQGDLVMLEAMGGGFTWGASLIRM